MNNEVTITIRMPNFAAMAEQVEREMPGLIAATLQTQRGMIFRREGAYNGRQKWAPLKHRHGQILRDTGTLSKSIGPRNDGINPGAGVQTIVRLARDVVTIGTELHYARIHNEGGIIPPRTVTVARKKNGRFAKITDKTKVVFDYNVGPVTIPARPFGDITPQDVAELNRTIERYLKRIFKGAGNG